MPSSKLATAQQRLTAAQARKRRAALGPVLALTDVTLDAAAKVDEHDLPTVEAYVRDLAGARGVDLLNAGRG